MRIKIDGWIYEVDKVYDHGYLPMIAVGRMEFYLAEDRDAAGAANRQYWEDMANDDPEEFTAIVGAETLVSWGLGQYAGPGYEKTKSLEEWLDMTENYPEEQWASHDGEEKDVDVCGRLLVDELGFTPTVAYRHN